ncbi:MULTISPECIES: hypothetical protein [Niastella]|uniref:Uncharacterized protein n=1 Tax=Niastella soli TaxID=2821487 RepID=A0ABS3Z3Q5_9BACT|nr:hypothetical protein [Niastella soli]MBO9204801.1 hypothetical protein [Niastella soli]
MINTLIRKNVILLLLAVNFVSCRKDIKSTEDITDDTPVKLKGVIPVTFDWKTVDYMPTPPGQTLIPVPWIGQGSLTSLYGIDVIGDNRHEDGWILLYSTFDANASGPLQNPYFILYNRFRGLMRIFLYLTGNFALESSHLTNGMTLLSGTPSQMLAYMGNNFVDLTQPHMSFTQIEKAPIDGSMPMATNKWFMMQYELAYDPQLASIPFTNMQLSWFTNYNAISQISLGGNIDGTIKGTIAASGEGSNNVLKSALGNAGKIAGTVGLAAVGSQFLNNAAGNYPGKNFTYDSQGNVTGDENHNSNNNLGLPDKLFTSMKDGMAAGLSAATGNIPGAVAGVFSAIFGGSSQPQQQTVSLNLNATLTLNGTTTAPGSFPASPTSIWVPGTQGLTASNSANIQGYIPLYENPLGVFSLSSAPTAIKESYSIQNADRSYENRTEVAINTNSYTIQFNPAVVNGTANGATISNLTQEVVIERTGNEDVYGTREQVGDIVYWTEPASNAVVAYNVGRQQHPYPIIDQAWLRISFDITPNNNPAARTKIIKTFVAHF